MPPGLTTGATIAGGTKTGGAVDGSERTALAAGVAAARATSLEKELEGGGESLPAAAESEISVRFWRVAACWELVSRFLGWKWCYNELIVRHLWGRHLAAGSTTASMTAVLRLLAVLSRLGYTVEGQRLPGVAGICERLEAMATADSNIPEQDVPDSTDACEDRQLAAISSPSPVSPGSSCPPFSRAVRNVAREAAAALRNKARKNS
eukprot:jgi/Mesen1/9698/ME000069S09113